MLYFFKILLPVCMPVVAVLALWQFVAMWNSYFLSLIHILLADATREKILRKAAEMGYKQFAYLPLFQEDAAKAAGPSILPSDKREIAMLTTRFLSNSHFSSMMLDRFQSEIDHLHSGMTIHRISPMELKEKKLPLSQMCIRDREKPKRGCIQ